MTKAYTRDQFVTEVYTACTTNRAALIETLMTCKIRQSYGEEEPASKMDFECTDEAFSLLGQPPLHVAVEKGFVDVVRALVTKVGVDVDMTDNSGWTPLHWACSLRREMDEAATEIVKILLAMRAEVGKVSNDTGDSPMHFAAANGHYEVVKMLVAEGANVNRTNNKEETPVHVAAARGNANVLKFFHENGGDMTRRDSVGGEEAHPLHLMAPAFFGTETIRLLFGRVKRNDDLSDTSSLDCSR